MSKSVFLSGQVPADQYNGLVDHEDVLLGIPTPEPMVAVVVIDRSNRKFNDVKSETTATVRFKHIEPLEGAAADEARKLLEETYLARTGEASLEFPIEDDELVEGGDTEWV